MRMRHRNIDSGVQEIKFSEKVSEEVVVLEKQIRPLRERFRDTIAPKHEAFQKALENVTKYQVKKQSPVLYTLLKRFFDKYASMDEINLDFNALTVKWNEECKKQDVRSAGLIEGGRLLLEIYRYYFIQAFYNKIIWRDFSTSANSFFPHSLSFISIVTPVIEKLKEEALFTQKGSLKQWMDYPFESFNDFRIAPESSV